MSQTNKDFGQSTKGLKLSTYLGRHITVTDKDIEKGVIADSRSCMNAEAIKRAIPQARNVQVDLATIRFTDKNTGNRYVFMTPLSVQKSIVEFDQGVKPPAFEFHLKTLFQIRPPIQVKKQTPIPRVVDQQSRPTGEGASESRSPTVIVGGPPIVREKVVGYIRRFGLRKLNAPMISERKPE